VQYTTFAVILPLRMRSPPRTPAEFGHNSDTSPPLFTHAESLMAKEVEGFEPVVL
jgi:hypothetical protein